jgi:hypothetical protein
MLQEGFGRDILPLRWSRSSHKPHVPHRNWDNAPCRTVASVLTLRVAQLTLLIYMLQVSLAKRESPGLELRILKRLL